MLQCVAVCHLCCSELKPEYVAVCCSVGWCVAGKKHLDLSLVFTSVAVCGSVSKCVAEKTHLTFTSVAVCSSVWKCVAVKTHLAFTYVIVY